MTVGGNGTGSAVPESASRSSITRGGGIRVGSDSDSPPAGMRTAPGTAFQVTTSEFAEETTLLDGSISVDCRGFDIATGAGRIPGSGTGGGSVTAGGKPTIGDAMAGTARVTATGFGEAEAGEELGEGEFPARVVGITLADERTPPSSPEAEGSAAYIGGSFRGAVTLRGNSAGTGNAPGVARDCEYQLADACGDFPLGAYGLAPGVVVPQPYQRYAGGLL